VGLSVMRATAKAAVQKIKKNKLIED